MKSSPGLLLSSLLLTACGGGGGEASLRFSANPAVVSGQSAAQQPSALSTQTQQTAATFQSSDGLTFTLREAYVHLRDIRLDLPKGSDCGAALASVSGAECKSSTSGDDSKTLVVAGPLVVNLMTGATTPDISGLRIPAGTYKRIDFRLTDAGAGVTPAALVGSAFHLQADFTHEGAPAVLDVRLDFEEDARFESPTGVEVGNGDKDSLLVLMKPQVWLQGLPVGSCLQKGNVTVEAGVLRLDEKAGGDCSEAEGLIKDAIKRSGDLDKLEGR